MSYYYNKYPNAKIKKFRTYSFPITDQGNGRRILENH